MKWLIVVLLFVIGWGYSVLPVSAGYCTGNYTTTMTYGCTSGGVPVSRFGVACCTLGDWYCTNSSTQSCAGLNSTQCAARGPVTGTAPVTTCSEAGYTTGPASTSPIICQACRWNEPGATPTPGPGPGPGTCSGITYTLSDSTPDPDTTVTVDINRTSATSCDGGWAYVGLKLDGNPQGLALCYADGTNCSTGYHAFVNSDSGGQHTLQFTVNNGTCLCNTTSFTTTPSLPPTCSVTGPTSVVVNDSVEYCVNPSDAPLGAEIWKSPTGNQTWTNVRPKTVGYGCSSTSFSQIGSYYVVCNAFGSGGGQCSGNPWCPWLPVALPEDSCTGWVDCTADDLRVVNVTAPGAWWQVKDSDVTTNGDILSRIYPAGEKFILDGPGGYPGVAVYGGIQAFFNNRPVSSKLWLANTTSAWLTKKTYNYKYFRDWLPAAWWDNTTPTPATITVANYFATTGTEVDLYYRLFYHEGDLTIDALQNMGSERAILFVNGGDLIINKNIQLITKGEGFFMAIVKGNIIIDPAVASIDPTVPSLEGFYTADNLFKTGAGNTQLKVRGSVVGLGGITLQRNLGGANSTTPAEVFEYAPDLVFTYPAKLSVRKMRWKEVAP